MARNLSLAPVYSRTAEVIYLILMTIGGAMGAAMVWYGVQIAWLGGTWYSLLVGLTLALAAVLDGPEASGTSCRY